MEEAAVTLPSIQRKLAAILSADVQGYSRLMGSNSRRGLNRLIFNGLFFELS